jgi:hypothetical protein
MFGVNVSAAGKDQAVGTVVQISELFRLQPERYQHGDAPLSAHRLDIRMQYAVRVSLSAAGLSP